MNSIHQHRHHSRRCLPVAVPAVHYLYQQSRQAYFRAWQIAWACYSIHYALDAFRYYRPPALAAFFFSSLFTVAMAMCIFVSTRLTRESFRFRWYDGRWL
jgi:hypothetical protein